ncbi:hypothetical protein JL721_11158 [Aureococcus anophagefferens]|nr:hypothetical protein JL721_11158 [Aureococcus anophagefferens]
MRPARRTPPSTRLKACLAHYAAEYHEGERTTSTTTGAREELKEAHHQTMVESFHHCLLDEMLRSSRGPTRPARSGAGKKAPPKPKERKLDDEARRRVDAMIHHHASIRKLLDDYFWDPLQVDAPAVPPAEEQRRPFASTKDPSKARRGACSSGRRWTRRYFDLRWGAIDDEAAERLITAAAAKPEYERLRDDLVVAVLDCDKKGEPDAKMVLRLLFHLASHDRSIIEMSWFEDQSGHPWPRPPGEAQAAARLDVATRTMREVAARDKFKFGEAIAPADDAPAPAGGADDAGPQARDAIERSEFSTPVSDEPPSVGPPTTPRRRGRLAKARGSWGSGAAGGVSQAATDAHHKSLSVPRRATWRRPVPKPTTGLGGPDQT